MEKPTSAVLEHKQAVMRRYRKLGAVWGALIGALIGIAGGCLQMTHWESPWIGCVVAPLALAFVGGCIGYFFYDLLFDSQIRSSLDDFELDANALMGRDRADRRDGT